MFLYIKYTKYTKLINKLTLNNIKYTKLLFSLNKGNR